MTTSGGAPRRGPSPPPRTTPATTPADLSSLMALLLGRCGSGQAVNDQCDWLGPRLFSHSTRPMEVLSLAFLCVRETYFGPPITVSGGGLREEEKTKNGHGKRRCRAMQGKRSNKVSIRDTCMAARDRWNCTEKMSFHRKSSAPSSPTIFNVCLPTGMTSKILSLARTRAQERLEGENQSSKCEPKSMQKCKR